MVQVKHKTFPAKHPLITQGAIGSTFFLLEEGEVKIVKDGIEVARLKSGAHFGEQALLKKQRRTADVIALTQIKVLEISKEDFMPIHALLGVAMAEEHASRLQSEAGHIKQAARPATPRLPHGPKSMTRQRTRRHTVQ